MLRPPREGTGPELWCRRPEESQGLRAPGKNGAVRPGWPSPRSAVPGDQNASQQRHRPTGSASRRAGACRSPFQGPLGRVRWERGAGRAGQGWGKGRGVLTGAVKPG